MAKALERVEKIAAFRPARVKVDKVPPIRPATLARVGLGSRAPILERTPEPRRTAALTSVVRHLEVSTIDDAPDVFALLMQVKLVSVAKRDTDREWLAARPRLAKASRTVQAALRLWSGQLALVEEVGAELGAATMWRALEAAVAPRSE